MNNNEKIVIVIISILLPLCLVLCGCTKNENVVAKYDLKIIIEGNGTTNPGAGIHEYFTGSSVTLTASPAEGWEFDSWTGDIIDNHNPMTISIDSDKTAIAVFTPKSYNLMINIIGQGAVSKNPAQSQYGTVVQLTAKPATGWDFHHWSGNATGFNNPTTITIDADKAVDAVFTQKMYKLTINIIGQGTVVKNPDQETYKHGTEVQVTANPALGWNFSGWNSEVSARNSESTIYMDKDAFITANFSKYQSPVIDYIQPSPPVLPDLRLINIPDTNMPLAIGTSPSPATLLTQLTRGTKYYIKTIVQNNGGDAGTFFVGIYKNNVNDQNLLTEIPILGLSEGAIINVIGTIMLNDEGNIRLIAVVDNKNQIKESYENNNLLEPVTVTVTSPPIYRGGEGGAGGPGDVIMPTNLFVSSIAVGRSEHPPGIQTISANETAYIDFIVTNNGTTNSFICELDFGNGTLDNLLGKITVPAISIGSQVTLSGNFTVSNTGKLILIAYVDAKNVVPELNENDNRKTVSVNVVAPAGYHYLENNLSSGLNLIRESPDTGSPQDKTYWLVNDNLLASYALKSYNPDLSTKLMASIEKYGYQHDNYIEILSGNRTTEPTLALDPNPTIVKDSGEYVIKTEKVSNTVMGDYDQYLDKLCYEALWYAYDGNGLMALGLFNQAKNMWDGKGFNDIVYKNNPGNGYATYKLAVFYYTAKVLGQLDILTFKDTLVTTMQGLQKSNGGFRTSYFYDGTGVLQSQSSTNTETTSSVLIALDYEFKALPPQIMVLNYTFPSATFNQTTSVTSNQTSVPALNNWKVTIDNSVLWATSSNNTRVAIGLFSSLAHSTDPSIQVIEYKDGSLDIVKHDANNSDGYKLNTNSIHWANPLTVSLASDKLSISSSAGTFSTSFTNFQLAYITGGSTESDVCSGGQVDIKLEAATTP